MENQPTPPETVPLIEAWMFGALLYPYALRVVTEQPPANDP